MDPRVRELAQTLWSYHKLGHELRESDAILVLCSYDKSVAARGAELWLEGWAPLLVYSGGLGVITRGLWSEPARSSGARPTR